MLLVDKRIYELQLEMREMRTLIEMSRAFGNKETIGEIKRHIDTCSKTIIEQTDTKCKEIKETLNENLKAICRTLVAPDLQ